MAAGDTVPWWDSEDPGPLLAATVDELRGGDEPRRTCLRILDDLYEGRTLFAAANGPALAAVGRSGLHAHLCNFARRAVDWVHSKVGTDVPSVRAAGHGADSSQRRRARLLTKFLAGASHELGLRDAVSASALGMLRTGTACTAVFERAGALTIESISSRDVIVDPDDGIRGRPRVLYHTPLVDRRALAHRFPDRATACLEAAPDSDPSETRAYDPFAGGSLVPDCVRLYEAWCLPLGDSPGRHAACLADGTTLLDEEWTDPRHPIALMPMSTPTRGTFGHGLLEMVDAMQFEIDDLMGHIGRSIRENNLKVIVDDPEASMEALSDPTVGTIIKCSPGSRPQWVTPSAVSPQDIQWLKELIGWLYQVVGMDEGAASSQRPAGLNSGRALQFYHDFQSLSYADLSGRVGRHVLDVAERLVDGARRLAASQGPLPDAGDTEDLAPGETKGSEVEALSGHEENTDHAGSWTVRYARGSETRQISWSEVNMDRDAFVIELEEVSAFPETLAGRMQQVEQDAAEGRVPPDVLAQLRLDPDLEDRWDRSSAEADFVDWLVECLLDPERPMPPQVEEAGQALRERIVDDLRKEVLRAHVAGEDPAVIARLQQYIAGTVAEMTPPAPPPQAAAPMGPALPTEATAMAPPDPGQMLVG